MKKAGAMPALSKDDRAKPQASTAVLGFST
jgi:hypothetical protein